MIVPLLLALALAEVPASADWRNVRVRVRSTFEVDARQGGAAVDVRPSRGGPRIGLRGGAGSTSSRTTAVQELLTLSGSTAELRVVRETPVAEWFRDWSLGHGLVTQTVSWQEVGTSLALEPTILPDGRIRLRLTPRLVVASGASPLRLDVVELSTEIVVHAGEEVDVGGLPMADESFRDRFFLGVSSGGRASRVRIVVSARPD
jgi:hypothetical protein